jgi:hypothetical protein
MKPAITMVRTRRGCQMLERTDRYDIFLFGKLIDQLFFNMTGYRGYLPTPQGQCHALPESGIGSHKKEIARLNREFAAAKLTSWPETLKAASR